MSTREDWAGDLGRRWAGDAEAQDRLLGVFEAPGFAALGPVEGRRVLDLGCGPGASALALARRGARVTGLDVSPDLLAIARRRAAEAGLAIDFVEADAAAARLDGPFDALFSRFGCMFFDDPVPAWRNLRGAMAPDAPLAAVAWRRVSENPWVAEPLAMLRDVLDPQERPAPGAPGPFGWADPDLPRGWLEAAGWREVAFAEAEGELVFGEGPAPAEDAAAAMMARGPLSRRIVDLDEARKAEARRRLEAGLARFVRDGAVRLTGAVWIVTARA